MQGGEICYTIPVTNPKGANIMALQLEPTIVITGHYGSGKTNLALNLAVQFRAQGEAVTLADLDIVNPYFRTSDFHGLAQRHGIEMIASEYAGSSLDIPALTGRLDGALGRGGRLIIDVGGDDAGATALGRYARRLKETGYTMLYVVSAYRYLTSEPAESVALLRKIEAASRLQATGIANCSSLGAATTAADVRTSVPYADSVSALTGLPVVLTAAHRGIAHELTDIQELLPVEIYVTTPWNEPAL